MVAPHQPMEPNQALPNETTMLIIPGAPPLQQTRHSRELGRRVEQLVRDYQREHPDVTEGDVRAALAQLSSGGPSPETLRRKRAMVIVIGALTAGAFTAMASTGGNLFADNKTLLPIIGVIAAVFGVVIAAFRLSRR
jgi:hypothetical protein